MINSDTSESIPKDTIINLIALLGALVL